MYAKIAISNRDFPGKMQIAHFDLKKKTVKSNREVQLQYWFLNDLCVIDGKSAIADSEIVDSTFWTKKKT